jgi:hypothetical protein
VIPLLLEAPSISFLNAVKYMLKIFLNVQKITNSVSFELQFENKMSPVARSGELGEWIHHNDDETNQFSFSHFSVYFQQMFLEHAIIYPCSTILLTDLGGDESVMTKPMTVKEIDQLANDTVCTNMSDILWM